LDGTRESNTVISDQARGGGVGGHPRPVGGLLAPHQFHGGLAVFEVVAEDSRLAEGFRNPGGWFSLLGELPSNSDNNPPANENHPSKRQELSGKR
jgi:hypothetical protein